jgi:hypothetical protein
VIWLLDLACLMEAVVGPLVAVDMQLSCCCTGLLLMLHANTIAAAAVGLERLY